MKKATTSRGLTYATLGILAVSSSLWAMYMQDNAFAVIGLLLGTAATAWQIHHYKATIPLVISSIRLKCSSEIQEHIFLSPASAVTIVSNYDDTTR